MESFSSVSSFSSFVSFSCCLLNACSQLMVFGILWCFYVKCFSWVNDFFFENEHNCEFLTQAAAIGAVFICWFIDWFHCRKVTLTRFTTVSLMNQMDERDTSCLNCRHYIYENCLWKQEISYLRALQKSSSWLSCF